MNTPTVQIQESESEHTHGSDSGSLLAWLSIVIVDGKRREWFREVGVGTLELYER